MWICSAGFLLRNYNEEAHVQSCSSQLLAQARDPLDVMQKMASAAAGFGFMQHSVLAEDSRWDFGFGWTHCDECGATPILNRGCGACLARCCKNCAPSHHCDGLTVTIQPGLHITSFFMESR